MVKVSGWTEKEEKYLIKWWHKKSNKEIGIDLGKTEQNVNAKANKIITFEMMSGRKWSEYEDELLRKLYGTMPMEELSNRMKRSERAIVERLKKIEGSHSVSIIQDVYTCGDISLFLGLHKETVLRMYKREQIPMHKLSVKKIVMDSEKFWEWLKYNLDVPNYLNIKDSTQLVSPKWYQELIKENKQKNKDNKSYTEWSSKEDALLWAEMMKNTSYKEIAVKLNRTVPSVANRVIRLTKKKMKMAN